MTELIIPSSYADLAYAHPGHGIEGQWHFISHGVESILAGDPFGSYLAVFLLFLVTYCLFWSVSVAIKLMKRPNEIKRG